MSVTKINETINKRSKSDGTSFILLFMRDLKNDLNHDEEDRRMDDDLYGEYDDDDG